MQPDTTASFVIQAFCLLLLISHGNPHIFSNPFHLQKLFNQFLEVGHTLRTSNIGFDSKPRVIKNYYHFWVDIKDDELPLQEKILEKLASNPVHIFQLIHSFRLMDQHLLPSLQDNKLLEKFDFIKTKIGWPGDEDFKGVIQGLLRVQFTYQLRIVDMAKGLIGNRQTNAYLSPEDCLFLAQERIDGNNPLLKGGGIDYAVAIEWAEAALALTSKSNEKLKEDIEAFLVHTKSDHDQYFQPPTFGGWSTHPNERFFISRFETKNSTVTGTALRLEENQVFQKQFSSDSLDYHMHIRDYHRLCRGEKLIFPNKPQFNGYCELRHHGDPWLILAPAKAEIMSDEWPFQLIVFHDVLTNNEIKFMQTEGLQKLVRAGLYVAGNTDRHKDNSNFTPERTQSSGWLWEYAYPQLQKISRKLDRILRLDVSTTEQLISASEAFQIGVYSPGGLYLPHHDAFEPMDIHAWAPNGTWIGNRIATAMFYVRPC